MSKRNPIKWLILNAAYAFIIFLLSFVCSGIVGTVFGWILPTDAVADVNGDLSRNFYLVYPLYGLVTCVVYFVSLYFISRTCGLRMGYKYREGLSKPVFIAQAVIGFAVYEILILYFMEWWDVLPTWFIAAFVSAITGRFDPSNVYSSSLMGFAEIDTLYIRYFLWIHILLEIVFAIGCVFVMKKGRESGEKAAAKAHEDQIAELEQERDKLKNAKTLK